MIEKHIEEYKKQIEEHRHAIIALTGAIQALERLQKEQNAEEVKSGDE